MRYACALITAVLALGGGVCMAAVQDHPAAAEAGVAITLHGEVIDPASYLRDGAHGSETADQAYEAVDGGQTLAILDEDTGTVYLLLAEQSGEDPNELAYDFVGQKVTVTGKVFERGSARGIVPTSIKPVEPAPAENPAAPPT